MRTNRPLTKKLYRNRLSCFATRVEGCVSIISGLSVFSPALLAAVMTHGPVAGGVTASAADIFVQTDTQANVQIEYSKNADLTASAMSNQMTTNMQKDYTAQLHLANLSATSVYYYRVLVNGQPQQLAAPYPKLTTFPPRNATTDFTFAVTSDVLNAAKNPTIGASVYQKVKNENPAFLLQLGDFDHSNPLALKQMRAMHQRLQGAETAHGKDFITHIGSQMPFFHVWDDHDIGMNNADKTFANKGLALQAYKEYYSSSLLKNRNAGVWHNFRYANAEFFLIDARSQRDVASDPESASKSMLDGDNIVNGQKTWLFDGLLSSTARWKFILSSVPFNKDSKPDDSWAAYKTERQALLDFIASNHITGVIILSGDMHTGGAIDTGLNAGLPEMSIPHTNLTPPAGATASGPAGTWDVGLISGVGQNGQGYGVITVQATQVVLKVKDRNGVLRLSYVVN